MKVKKTCDRSNGHPPDCMKIIIPCPLRHRVRKKSYHLTKTKSHRLTRLCYLKNLKDGKNYHVDPRYYFYKPVGLGKGNGHISKSEQFFSPEIMIPQTSSVAVVPHFPFSR